MTPPSNNELLAGKLELMTAERDKLLLELGDLRALRAVRPTNCGSGHCSCVECVMPTDQQKLMSITGTGEPGSRGRMRAPTASGLTLEGDRAALIECLQFHASLAITKNNIYQQAADMLAADALQSAQFTEAVDANARLLVRMEGLKRVQKVVVAQSLPRIHVTEAMHRAAVKVLHRAHGLDGLPQRMLNAMLAAAPQPPQADALATHHVEDVRAMVPMTAQELDDLLPTNDSMSRKDSQRWIARATERHHKIGVKP